MIYLYDNTMPTDSSSYGLVCSFLIFVSVLWLNYVCCDILVFLFVWHVTVWGSKESLMLVVFVIGSWWYVIRFCVDSRFICQIIECSQTPTLLLEFVYWNFLGLDLVCCSYWRYYPLGLIHMNWLSQILCQWRLLFIKRGKLKQKLNYNKSPN